MAEKRDEIILRGLQENNLKNVDLNIPKEKINVFTGLSGSGKSSVVFDTLATESRRQMTLNYPLYIRHQMPRYERPRADLMQHLSPVVVVEQKPVRGNSRSTVGTYMDIDPLIRLLFSRIGSPPIGSAAEFSSDSSFGKCPECNGLGEIIAPDVHKLIDHSKSLRESAVRFRPLAPPGWQGRWMVDGGLFDPDLPIKDYTEEKYNLLVYGPREGERAFSTYYYKVGNRDIEWDGILPRFIRLYINRDLSKLKVTSQDDVLAVTARTLCPTCEGSGLNPKVLESKINGLNIAQYDRLEMTDLLGELAKINDPVGTSIAQQVLPGVKQLVDLGLGYLCLARKVGTLSGGEAQRVKIARHLGSSLNNITYIFDEPSAGLHPEEIEKLTHMLKSLRDNYNTVVVIEHNLAVIKTADEIIEMGPGAGVTGGRVVYQGAQEGLQKASAITDLNHKVAVNKTPRQVENSFSINNASANNLKNVSVEIPKNVLVSVCGVSGSGKSSLMFDAFIENYPETIAVRQSSIGTSSRSTLATYMGIMDDIRSILAKETGQPVGLFSFNSIGACPVCEGKGVTTPDVAFADPVTVTCEACKGTRYSDESLSYRHLGKNIVEILELSIDETNHYLKMPKIVKKVDTLKDVGLGYLTLGQTTSSLSGGEVQRLKLASHLKKEGQIYLLDEPSLGLHTKDNAHLLAVFQGLVDRGNSVILIEHNLDFIAASDWVIEMGPGGGKRGGEILFEGTPEAMLESDTVTAKWLRKDAER
ncbi:ATP-binding cassette domain-containing protein [Planococcus halocryophilus]|uniref:ATP-binding cassette domain-containing protein n=1 Tax=Planococcus halocryophilus TaxID=1215089 RepID=UPI001F0DDDB3|nr:ATP-binding cassette domain-containing protein [Planococcus halocryophilus]MCH4826384.1 ATP-binding cassette domain-containing protein [Planococcus halocryophilus]